MQPPADPELRGPRAKKRPYAGIGADLVDGGEELLHTAVEPVDGGVRILGRSTVAYIARVQRLAAALGDDLRGPTISAPDVAEQLVECPVRTRRYWC